MKKCLLLILFCSLCFIGQAQQGLEKLFFEVNQHQLTTEHKALIDAYLSKLDFKTVNSLELSGFTDSTASNAYNINLSQKRVNAVKAYIIKKGMIANRIRTSYYGEKFAKNPNNMRLDRVVQLKWSFTPDYVTDDTATTIKDFFKASQIKPNVFCIDPNKDNIVTCDKGTIVIVKANSFNYPKGSPKAGDCVRFEVKEVFLKSEMILENLNTTSDGRILETQGMIYTNAMLGDDTLSLKQDIVIMQPTDSIIEGVKIFEGQRDAHTDEMNWSLSNNTVLRNFDVMDIARCAEVNNICGGFCNWGRASYLSFISDDPYWQCWYYLCFNLMQDCDTCKFFVCRIGRIGKPIAGAFNSNIRADNKRLRACQRWRRYLARMERKRKRNNGRLTPSDMNSFLRRVRNKAKEESPEKLSEVEQQIADLTELMEKSDDMISKGLDGLISKKMLAKCSELDSLFKVYGVESSEELILAINKPLLDEFGVTTMKALLDTLPKVNLAQMEVAYKNKRISFEDYKFYVFNSSKLGWSNVDVFADIPESKMTKLHINIKPEKTIDVKLVFKDREFVLPAKIAEKTFYFEGIPKGEQAWVVAIKYEEGKPYLAMKLITVAKQTFDVEFKNRSLEELKEDLKILDFEDK